MMILLIPVIYCLIGASVLLVLIHALALKDPQNRKWHLYLLINTAAGAGYLSFAPHYYQLSDPQEYLSILKGQMFFTPVFLVSYLLFIRDYSGLKTKPAVTASLLIFCLFPFIRLFDPMLLTYTSIKGMEIMQLPWGETATRVFPESSIVGIIYYCTVLVLLGAVIWASFRGKFRKRSEQYAAAAAAVVLAVSGISDVVIDSFSLSFPYTAEFSFAALMYFSSFMVITELFDARSVRVELDASRERYKLLVENLPLCFWIRNSQGDFEYLSTAGVHLFGKEKMTRREFLQFIHDDDAESADAGFTRMMQEDHYVHEYRITTASGERIVRDLSFGTLPADSGAGRMGFIEDISQLRNAEKKRERLAEQLHQSQKMEAVGQLAGGVAHDFNNALGGILGAAELLRSEGISPAEQCELIDLIITAGERASELTKKLLTFSRRGGQGGKAVDCLHLVNETVSLLQHTIHKNIAVKVENRAVLTSVIGDSSLLQNALMNMGINAGHAMPMGGELTFTLENLELDAEYCEVSPFELQPGQYLEIAVRDTGTGMPPEIVSRIFEPFFTTKEAAKGTGLGLASVYGTVQEHHGAVTVYSEVGSGTVFHLYLPITAERIIQEIESEITGGTGTVLLIDDEDLIRITASALLRSLGYRVICAENGMEGVTIFEEAHEEIDLIILDMIMPVMGGREAFLKLREIDHFVPIIIASGFAKEEDVELLRSQGISGFLHKPFRKAELASAAANALR